MTAVLVAGAVLVSSFWAAQKAPPTTLQTDGASNPTAVTDHLPYFQFQNPSGNNSMSRYQIQVTTDPTFVTITHWNSPGPNGGTSFPGNVTLNPAGTSPQIPYRTGANLQTAPLLSWNQIYYWQAQFGKNGAGTWSGFSTANFKMASPTWAINQQSNNGSSSVASWRFIGVPIAFGTTVPASELLSSVSLLYKLDEPTRTWIQLTPTDLLEGGRGYLAWCGPTTVLNLSQGSVLPGVPAVKDNTGVTTTASYTLTGSPLSYTSLTVPTGQEITDGVGVNGYAGNCLFANPYYAPISWTSSTTPPTGFPFGDCARLNISYAMYKWDGTQYLMYNGVTGVGNAGDTIAPFQAVGIWIQAGGYLLDINTPAPLNGGHFKAMASMAAAAPVPPSMDSDHWHLILEARSGTAVDTENAFGLDPKADDAWDIRDSEEPGTGTATWVNLYFDHRSDWTTYPRKYTHDFRNTRLHAGDQVTWTFTVDGNTGLPATLTWPNLANISATDWKFTLNDPATSTTLDLSTASSYDTQPVNGPTTMTMTATRLTDSPTLTTSTGSSKGNCGLLGPEGLLLAGWLLARRACKMRKPS